MFVEFPVAYANGWDQARLHVKAAVRRLQTLIPQEYTAWHQWAAHYLEGPLDRDRVHQLRMLVQPAILVTKEMNVIDRRFIRAISEIMGAAHEAEGMEPRSASWKAAVAIVLAESAQDILCLAHHLQTEDLSAVEVERSLDHTTQKYHTIVTGECNIVPFGRVGEFRDLLWNARRYIGETTAAVVTA